MKALTCILISSLPVNTLPALAADSERQIRRANGYAGVGLPASATAKNRLTAGNSPTVLNAGFQRLQYWDGRAKNLSQQAWQAILSPSEMTLGDDKTVGRKIGAIKDYQEAFKRVFPDGKLASEAMAALERTLITPSQFDDFLNGDAQALNQADEGLYPNTHETSDPMVFRVSQLRNIALTEPYFYDGQVATLEQAV